MIVEAEIRVVPRADLHVRIDFFYGDRIVHTSGGVFQSRDDANDMVTRAREALNLLGISERTPVA